MKNILKVSALVMAMLFVAFAFAGCGEKASDKVYTIVSDNAFAPFESYDAETKTYVGVDMDILAAIAEDQGFSYNMYNVGFDPALG